MNVDFDLIVKGGWVIDGSGGPPFRADVGLLDTMIAAVGPARRRRGGARSSTSTGRYVVPGFIDAHVHGDLMLLADPIHLPALRQGVTTYIIGQDGSSFAPASPATLDYMRRYTAGFNGNPDGGRLRLADGRRVPRPLRPPDGAERGVPDPQRQRPDGGDGPRPAPGHRRRAPRDAGPGPRGDGRRRGRALDGPRLHPQPLRRRPRDRRPLRGDRPRRRRLRHPHAGLRPAGAGRHGRGLRDRPSARGSPRTSRTTTARPTCCSR